MRRPRTALRWRIPGTPADLSFRDLLRTYPFTVLEEGEHWSLSGMCGRIWTRARDYPRIDDAGQFRAWDQPGTVRVIIATWIERGQDGGHALVSESRVQAVDARAASRRGPGAATASS